MKNSITIKIQLITLIIISYSNILLADCLSPSPLQEQEQLIEVILQGGGSYTAIQNAEAYNDWAILETSILDNIDISQPTTIPMPFGLELFQLACTHKDMPMFTITPKYSGDITVRVKTYGNFRPDLAITSNSHQKEVGHATYEATFYGQAKQTYRINIHKTTNEHGLYSIELLQ